MNVTPEIKAFGNTDIYLIDAILKEYFRDVKSVLDAGCGEGRNLPYFLMNNYRVRGIDENAAAIRLCRIMAKSYQKNEELYDFTEGDLRTLPYNDHEFELVIISAVLHFASNENDFLKMLEELVRVTKSGGILFIRMASNHCSISINSENNFTFLLPIEKLESLLKDFNLEKMEPVKSVLVEDKRVMTTLVLRKK